ncbi:MAG: hypothetical protein ACR2P1_19385 [Pseudomonadales bacterium]
MNNATNFIFRSTVVGSVVMLAFIANMEFAAEKQAPSSIDTIPLFSQQQTVSGSRLGHRNEKQKYQRAVFDLDRETSTREGFAEAHQAVLAFYEANEQAYQQTDKDQELVAMLVVSTQNRYYVTKSVQVPASFKLRAAVRLPKGWKAQEVIHTHPPTFYSQEGFSVDDRKAVLGGLPGYYVRTPLGDVRYLDKKLAKTTRHNDGAHGKSICLDSQACMTAHNRKG